MTYAQHKAAFAKLIREAAHRHDVWRVFSDFVEMAAISIANQLQPDDEREERYRQVVGTYSKEEAALFPEMLGHVVMGLECQLGDFLGESFMELDLGNSHKGQFFTPYSLCQAIAAMNSDIAEQVSRKGFITVSDPAVGGAALLIAFAEEARRQGINYQRHVHATGQDVDIKAVHMAYVQLSLIGMPAVLIHGNTLAMEERSRWCTPFHVLGNWDARLRARTSAPPAPTEQPHVAHGEPQLELF